MNRKLLAFSHPLSLLFSPFLLSSFSFSSLQLTAPLRHVSCPEERHIVPSASEPAISNHGQRDSGPLASTPSLQSCGDFL